MSRKIQEAILSLSNVYAKYFVEDYTNAVIENLGTKIALESSVKEEFLNDLKTSKLAQFSIDLNKNNAVTNFIQECATYAVENDIRNSEKREVFDEIRDLPSIYHEEVQQFLYQASSVYLNTVDKTLLSVVGKDAAVAAGTIVNSVKSRIESEETGGRVKFFNWGILSDGLWLNSALVKAYEMASIFRPGSKVDASFVQTGFASARNYVGSPIKSDINSAFNLIIANLDNKVIDTLNGDGARRWDIKSLIFNPGSMTLAIDFWEKSVSRPQLLMESVEHLSQLAEVIPQIHATAKQLENEDQLNSDIVNRIENVNSSITLCLAAFEAARETIYGTSLVLYVSGEGADPMVDVFVNQDTVNDYKNAGGEESDLVSFGNYLDPRSGMITGKGGWTLEWATKRRNEILAEVSMKENALLEKKRANDRNVIQMIVKDTLSNVTRSYAEASNITTLPNRFNNQIGDIARKVSSPTALESFSLEGEIVTLLTNVIGDKFISDASSTFIGLAGSGNEVHQKNARDLTIVAIAFDDVVDILKAA